MKKVLAIIAIVMLVPFTAFGMEMMADTALEDVTAQAGVSIAIVDVNMDMSINNIAWGDIDTSTAAGNMDIAGIPVEYTAGWINMNNFKADNIFVTMLAVLDNNTTNPLTNGIYADPLKIDVATLSDTAPFTTVRGETAVCITLGDALVQVENMSMDIYVDNAAYSDTGATFNSTQGTEGYDSFLYSASTLQDQTAMMGSLIVSGITMKMYHSPGGYVVDGTGAVSNPNAAFPARVYIWAH